MLHFRLWRVTCHKSHVIRYTSHVTRHTSHVTRHKSHVTRHTSNVTRHSSHVTRHTSHVTPHSSHALLAFRFSSINWQQPRLEGVLLILKPQTQAINPKPQTESLNPKTHSRNLQQHIFNSFKLLIPNCKKTTNHKPQTSNSELKVFTNPVTTNCR